MKSIAALVAKHAPNGVEEVPLREVGTWYGGGTPSKAVAEFWDNGNVPWLSPKDMDVETVAATGLAVAEAALAKSPLKLVPAGSVAFVVRSNVLRRRLPIALVPFETTLNQDMRAVVPRGGILPEYLLHLCRSRSEAILAVTGRTDGSMAAINSSALLDYRVPIPPVPVQQEVVRVVKRLGELQTALEAELAAELVARKKQFAYYRAALLEFDSDSLSLSLSLSLSARPVTWTTLSEVATVGTGSHDTKDAIPDGDYVFYARGRDPLRLDSFDFDERAIITAGDGVGVGKVFHFADGKYALHLGPTASFPARNLTPGTLTITSLPTSPGISIGPRSTPP